MGGRGREDLTQQECRGGTGMKYSNKHEDIVTVFRLELAPQTIAAKCLEGCLSSASCH